MKKKIEVYVKGCDKCGRHDMELPTCIGCGVSLCSFCGIRLADTHSMATHNRLKCFYSGFRRFYNTKEDIQSEYRNIFFCITCLLNPKKHRVIMLLKACIRREEMQNRWQLTKGRHDKALAKANESICSGVINRHIQHCPKGRYWEVLKCGMNAVVGEEVEHDQK